METLRAGEEGAREALERLETAVIALDGDARVVSMTGRAEVFLRRGDTLRLVEGRLVVTNASQAEVFDHLVRSAALTGAGRGTAGGAASGGAMRLY
jgi:hypothetical protein